MTEKSASTARVLCQVCGESIGEDRVCCSRCHAPHHRDCWEFNGGCSIFACGGRECWRSDPRGDLAQPVVYIEENTPLPPPPEPLEKPPFGRSWALDGRFLWVMSVLVLYVLKGIESDVRSSRPQRPPARPSYRSSQASRRVAQPQQGWLLGLTRLTVDVTDGAGKIVIPRDTLVRVYEADRDGRHKIEAPGGEVRWVSPSSFATLPNREAVPRSVLALAQLVHEAKGLPKGEIVQIVGEATVMLPQVEVNIHSKVYEARTSSGRLVRGLSPTDISLVERSAAGLSALQSDFSQKAMLQRLKLLPGSRAYLVLVEPASVGGSTLGAGTFLELTGTQSSQDEPIFYRGRSRSGAVAVPANCCRPILTRELALEAARSLGQAN